MRLGTLKSSMCRDGVLVLISQDGKRACYAQTVSPFLRDAVENWKECAPKLQSLAEKLEADAIETFPVDETQFHSPLPRAFQWADGSAFVHHIRLVRKARNAAIPETLLTVPLMYQGGSDDFLAPYDPIPQVDFAHGTDFEAEVAVVVDDVPMGIAPEDAVNKILLIMLCNDISLRGLVPEELALGFGFFQSKPSSSFSPFALTPSELGEHWQDGTLNLPLNVYFNGNLFGCANAAEMHFHFGELIAHAARTRNLKAGAIIGSGTVSNKDSAKGSSCIAEKRMLEKINHGEMITPFMKEGDSVKIEMVDLEGRNLFGSIHQKVQKVD